MLKPHQLKKFAESSMSFGDVYSGIDLYERYVKLKPDNADALFELAELYRRARDYKKAAEAYLKCYETDSKYYINALFYHAQMLKSQGDYEAAKANFLKFQKENKGAKANEFKKILKIELEGCEMGIKDANPDNAKKADITRLDNSINKPHIEFSPLMLDTNRLLYGSLRSDTIIYYSVESDTAKKVMRKFFTAKKSGSSWTFEDEFKGPFNTEKAHAGNGVFSKDGNTFYFTRCESDWQNKVICSVFMSKKEGEEWIEPVEIQEINNKSFTTTMPAVGDESKKKQEALYFVSDRPGGVGGMDIWYSVYDEKKQQWDTPKNAGKKLNTPGDEITPYYDLKMHTLYFSSNGWAGFGGMDIFKTNGEMNKWTKPENIGYPLNTGADEVYFIMNPKNTDAGFFTSNREGGASLKNPTCCDDIYEFLWKDYKNLIVEGKLYDSDFIDFLLEMEDDKEKNQIIEEGKKFLLDNATVSVYLIDKENEEPILISTENSDEKGEYSFKLEKEKEYKVVVNKDGYLRKHHKFSTKNVSTTVIYQHIGLKKLEKEPIVIKNIYYLYDDYKLSEESKRAIDSTFFILLRENPQIIIEISSHTDSKGADDYNMKLSQKRAESVVNYLVEKGIDKERMKPQGYGESKPIAENTNKDGSDNPDGRAKNRRTEFKIIGSLDKEKYEDIIYKE